ncbi:hypothetical protein VNO78_05798 [Psophocarpus tetragonolobus]|uniref:Uncharacterized protein n=1 Tax=Psophocarpus tetragonolobus TaxID=3891 RepID=A0AAN9T194_PSOTE
MMGFDSSATGPMWKALQSCTKPRVESRLIPVPLYKCNPTTTPPQFNRRVLNRLDTEIGSDSFLQGYTFLL